MTRFGPATADRVSTLFKQHVDAAVRGLSGPIENDRMPGAERPFCIALNCISKTAASVIWIQYTV